MLSNKEISILEVFLQNKGQAITSKEVAERLKLSDRTIRNYIKGLQQIILENGAEIAARAGHGYTLKVNNEIDFNTFLQENDINSMKKNEIHLDDAKDRKYYILNKLLFEEDCLLFDDLCDELYVCRSTLSNDFAEIRELLRPYNLSVISKVKKGVYVEGDERDKRHFIMDYFFGNSFSISINKYVGNTLFLSDISFEEITIIVLDECREAGLRLSDYIIQNLVLHIALVIKRIKDGFKLDIRKADRSIEDIKEFQVAKRILKRITSTNKIDFPDEEAYYIALHLKVKSIVNDSEEITDFNEKNEFSHELNEVLSRIENDTGYPMKNDKQLINGLMTHFYPLSMRLKAGVTLENPLLDEIREKYGRTLKLTKDYLSSMSLFKDYKVSDGEYAYICLHFMAAIERYRDNSKLNVLVICATGYGSGQMLSIRLKKEFGQHINIVDVIGYYEITDERLRGIDLIISSIDLYTIVFNVPVIHTSVFLNNSEINEIRNFIENSIYAHHKNEENSCSKMLCEKMSVLENFIDEDCFHIIDEPTSKEKVIKELVGSIQKHEESKYSEIMLKQIAQRETMSSVVFSREVAVPHPAKAVGKNAHFAIAIIKDGVYWNDQFQKIKFVFLLSPSKLENVNLKNITGAIVSLIDDNNVQKQLLKCRDFNEFKEIFAELI
ncbi:MAG: PRD domain-containing protein [Clostridium sp.]|nr:PRD domain-containing protein [Clostridium sp.]